MDYKFSKKAGALNELAAPTKAPARQRASGVRSSLAQSNTRVEPPQQQQQQQFSQLASLVDGDDYASAHNTDVSALGIAVAAPPTHAQSRGGPPPPVRRAPNGLDPHTDRGGGGMFFYTVLEGQRVRVLHEDGRVAVVAGPSRVFRWGKRFERMAHYVAHPGEFLIVRYRDGRQEHLQGPADVWLDEREHTSVAKEDALQLAAKEAVVAYARDGATGRVTRRIVYGPATFVPAPGEWLHTFSWHGSRGAEHGYEKVPNALVFQKLWMMPDQMYHDVPDVRTADDAVLTVRLMLFFELVDVEKMLDSTHDPIGDFVNAATSDVVDFVARHDLESFKRHTDRLNDLGAYAQLVSRAAQCGYRINKVVYRGYGATESLQRMHDEAIESRTRLQLERATQEQAQDLEDFKQTRAMGRGTREREEQRALIEHQLEQERLRREAELLAERARRDFAREQARLDEERRLAQARSARDAERAHLEGLRTLGVDLTKLLAERRADRVIELRGGEHTGATHVHVNDRDE